MITFCSSYQTINFHSQMTREPHVFIAINLPKCTDYLGTRQLEYCWKMDISHNFPINRKKSTKTYHYLTYLCNAKKIKFT